jgi:hypothetical protein
MKLANKEKDPHGAGRFCNIGSKFFCIPPYVDDKYIIWFLFRLCSAEVTRVCIYLLPMKVYECELVIKILNPLSSYE